MKEIFGLSTTVLMMVMLVLLALCLLVTAFVAIRRPVIFKLGIRNIPRRKAQTILIVVGLMLSTLLIAAAMTTGDTINYSFNKGAYDLLGHTDEIVVQSSEVRDANISSAITNKIPGSSLATVQNAVAGDSNVVAVAPTLLELVPVMNTTSGLGEPEVTLMGINPADIDAFGGLKSLDGGTFDANSMQPGQIVLNETATEKLDATIGDTISVQYNNQALTFTVVGTVTDQILSGAVDTGESPGMWMPLDEMQRILGMPDQYSAIIISNDGPVRGSEKLSDAVVDKVAPALEGQNLGIYDVKQDILEQGELFSNIFTSLFLVMGLFSMAAGVMLIVLIFSMLAAERRAEMGMERAIGAQRRQLIQQFIAEGTGYAIFAGLVGSALGVVVALGISAVMGRVFGDFLNITPHVELRSLVIAYCLGVVITFLAVVVGSWRISRLNIVSAIRDIPEVAHHRRRPRILVFGVLLIALGVLLSVSAGDSMLMFGTGMSLWPFGVVLLARFFGVPTRLITSLAGLWIVVFWLLPDSTFRRIFGEYTGGFELFFVSGIFLVAGATVLIVQNTDLLLGAVSSLGGVFKSRLPAIRTAVAYPGAARSRTGMTIAMFSLIVFSLVMMATIVNNFSAAFLSDKANAGWTVRADGGFTNPIDDFEGTLQSNGIDTSQITAIGQVDSPVAGSTEVRLPGDTDWQFYTVRGGDAGFYEQGDIAFTQRAIGYESDQQIIDALTSGQPFAVIDQFALSGNGDFGGGGFTTHLTSDDLTFEPFEIDVLNPADGTIGKLTVIGVIDPDISSLFGIFTNRETTDAIFHGDRGFTSYYISTADGVNAEDLATSIESKLLLNGVQATSIQKELKDQQSQSMSFFYVIEGFMALGLVVGIAAIGVIAFRSVVERRQQIGVLRAIGFQRSMVSLSFMIETLFVVGLGIISGGGMGLLLARNLFASPDFASGSDVAFTVPWLLLIGMVVATIVASLLMTWIPARQASMIAPAEALRYE